MLHTPEAKIAVLKLQMGKAKEEEACLSPEP